MTDHSQGRPDEKTPNPLEAAEREDIALEPSGAGLPADADETDEEGTA